MSHFFCPAKCITTWDGGQNTQTEKNTPCVEGPWKYGDDDTEYEGCANPDKSDQYNKGFWCPTELDDDGRYNGKWGFCDMRLYSCNPGGEDKGSFLNIGVFKILIS